MAYIVDRVVICDAFQEPEQHYQLLAGGRSKRAAGRRPSMRFLASAKDTKGAALLERSPYCCRRLALYAC